MHILSVIKSSRKYRIEPGDELVKPSDWADSLPEALISYCANNPEENLFYMNDGSNRDDVLKPLDEIRRFVRSSGQNARRITPADMAHRFAEYGFDIRPSGDLQDFSDDDTEAWIGGSLTFELPNVLQDLNGLKDGHKIIIDPNPQYGIRIVCAEQGVNAGNSRLDIDIESRGAGGLRKDGETQQSGLGIACFPPTLEKDDDTPLPQTMDEAALICNLPVAAGSGPAAVIEDPEVRDWLKEEQREKSSTLKM